MNGASKVSVIILGVVSIANFAYAGYRSFFGLEGSSLPLIAAGTICLTLAAILMARSGKS
ncbi:MAG: hypothetical protein RLN72_15225 [Henriciella sp.]